MASAAGTLEFLAREVARALQPLADRLADGGADGLIEDLGLRLPTAVTNETTFGTAVSNAAAAAASLAPLVDQLTAAIDHDDEVQIVQTGVALIEAIGHVIDALPQVASALDAAAAASSELTPADRAEVSAFAGQLASRILDLIAIEYIEANSPPTLPPVLTILGVFDRAEDPGVPGDPLRPPHFRKELHLERLSQLFHDPSGLLRDVYAWGDPSFDGLKLFTNIQRFLERDLELPADLILPPGLPAILEVYRFALRVDDSASPPGLVVDLRFPATQDFERTYPLVAPFALTATANARFVADVGASIRPPFDAAFLPPLGGGTVDVVFAAGIAGDGGGERLLLLGSAGGSRFEAGHVGVSLGLSAHFDAASGRATGEPTAVFEVRDGHLVIGSAGSDGFVSTILGGRKIEGPFELKASWSPSKGIVFTGGAGLEFLVPVQIGLGPVEIHALSFRLAFTSDAPVRIEVGASIAATLGPIAVSVDRIGAAATMTFPPGRDGNLGPVNFGLDFLPPSGLGIVVGAGPITGGGFLSFDAASGRYAGILQLEAADISVSAIGLVDTRMPDGSAGFSFLIIVAVELPPIQLGYGFTLNGVGGIAGIYRSAAVAVLRQDLLTGTLERLMFPADPVRNAAQIISDVSAVFPPTAGRFVFGPMLEIGWGTPTLVSARIGVVLELPDPLRILILAAATVAIPEPDVPIVSLHLDALGVIDFEEESFSLDATLYDSSVAGFPVSGDMAMRLSWSAPPNLALAIGGLHPQFRPPPGFPTLRRVTIEIGHGGNPRLTCQAYLAITSNSLQTGAKVELYASAGSFNIHGWLGYDALIIIRPLSFRVDISAGVELRRNTRVLAGIHVHGTLTGPSPWHAKGEACLSLFFFDICVPFSVTVGDPIAALLTSIDPLPDLLRALQDPRSWESGLARGIFRAVSFARPTDQDLTLIDPAGSLGVLQRVLPFNRRLEKFGEAALLGADRYDVGTVTIGSAPVAFRTTRDFFAPGQFQELTDDQKLSRDSYESMDAGVVVDDGGAASGGARAVPVEYETIVIDAPDGPEAPLTHFVKRPLGVFVLEAVTLVSRAERVYGAHIAASLRAPYVPPQGATTRVALSDEAYVIASTLDLSVRPDLGAPDVKGAILEKLDAHLAAHPDERGLWQVVPVGEAEIAA